MGPSSTIPYATATDLLLRQDWNAIAMLVSDTGTPDTYNNLLDPGTDGGLKVFTALMDATGEIESACTQGTKYSPDSLLAMTGGSRYFLSMITCHIAMMILYDRRDGVVPPENVIEKYKRAQTILQNLVDGVRVFGILENQKAGLPANSYFTPTQRMQNGLISTDHRFWGYRKADRRTSWPF